MHLARSTSWRSLGVLWLAIRAAMAAASTAHVSSTLLPSSVLGPITSDKGVPQMRHFHSFQTHQQIEGTLSAYDIALEDAKSFQYNWAPRSNVTRLLLVAPMHHYLNNMDRFLYKVADAAVRHPAVNATIWGPGWAGYNAGLSLQANLRQTFGCFDVIFAKLGAFTGEQAGGQDLFAQWEAYEPCPGETMVEELADCHELECLKHPGHKNGHVISSRFAMILPELFYPGGMDPPKSYAHIPDCVPSDVAPPLPWADKDRNVTLLGHTWAALYPLRPRMAAAIADGLIPGAVQYTHPGYSLAANILQPGVYEPHHAAIATAEAQLEHYHKAIAQSKVCMFDSSIVRKGLAKYFEAMMGGCVVAADVPLEMEAVLQPAMIVLDPADSAAQIASKVNAALADPEQLQRKAALGLQAARQHFTCEAKLDRILDAAAEHKAGFRGFSFPFGFRLGCHSYHTSDNRPSAAWCGQRQ